jgi:spermidine/putrescine transport system substrate-binding protein
MLAKLGRQPRSYDVIQPSGYYVRQLAARGALHPLQLSRFSNLGNLDPQFRSLPFDPENRYSIPWMAGTVGIVFNAERVMELPERFEDVFSGKFAGRIVVVNDAREMVAWALTALHLPITDVSDSALARVGPVLESWLPQVAVFDSDQPSRALESGRADVGIVWNGEAALLWRKDHKYHYVLPKVGAHRFVDNLAIPAGAPHPVLAEAFLDYILRPEVSVEISRAYPYTNPNLAARALLTPEELSNPASYPPGDPALPMLHNDGSSPEQIEAFVRGIKAKADRAK